MRLQKGNRQIRNKIIVHIFVRKIKKLCVNREDAIVTF